MKPKTRPSASAADDKDNPGSAPISADEIRVIMREELANVIANELGPRLMGRRTAGPGCRTKGQSC